MFVRSRHRHTLEQVFASPTPADVRWADIAAMLEAAGVEIVERSGSRVLLRSGADRIVVHRPHPRAEAGRATVRDIARFLGAIGVTP